MAEKSVAKVAEHSDAVSVAAQAGTFKTASQKTEVGSAVISGAAVSGGLQGSVPRQSSTAIAGCPQGTGPQDSAHQRFVGHYDHQGVVSGQGCSSWSCGFNSSWWS